MGKVFKTIGKVVVGFAGTAIGVEGVQQYAVMEGGMGETEPLVSALVSIIVGVLNIIRLHKRGELI